MSHLKTKTFRSDMGKGLMRSGESVGKAFGSPPIALSAINRTWLDANHDEYAALFQELRLEKDRGFLPAGAGRFWCIDDTAAKGITMLIIAGVIERVEGELFLTAWRANDEQPLLPDNNVMRLGLWPIEDPVDTVKDLAHRTFSEVECWRLLS